MDWVSDNVNSNQKEPRLSDLVEVLVVPDGEGKDIRPIGPARRVAKHWIQINTKTGKQPRIPRVCLAFDDTTGNFDGECPYCTIDPKRPGIEVHQNVIDRDAQEAQPARVVPPNAEEKAVQEMKGYRCRIKRDKSSKAWTPVRLAVMNSGHSNPVKDMVKLNKHKVRDASGAATVKLFGPEHPRHGFDVTLLYNSKRAAAQRYSAQKGDETAITEEERRYLLWDIYTDQPKPLKEAQRDAAELAPKVVQPEGAEDATPAAQSRKPRETTIDDNEDWDSDEPPAKPAARGGRRAAPADDDFDEEPAPARRNARRAPEPVDEDDGFDDEPAPRRTAGKPARRAAPAEDDGFDDEPAPARRKTRAAPVDDDFDEEPAPRRTASKPARRAPVDEDDGFDDEPAPRRANAASARGKPRPRAPEPDDDDLGADDDDGWDE